MPRLVDANKVAEAITWLDMLDFALWHDVQKCIDKLPTVDAIPVVRCKDCKFYWKNNRDGNGVVCLATPKDDAFCSEGERKEDETD